MDAGAEGLRQAHGTTSASGADSRGSGSIDGLAHSDSSNESGVTGSRREGVYEGDERRGRVVEADRDGAHRWVGDTTITDQRRHAGRSCNPAAEVQGEARSDHGAELGGSSSTHRLAYTERDGREMEILASGSCGSSDGVGASDESGSDGLYGWKRVSFAADCLGYDEETGELGDECSICGLTYAEDCECPGPTRSAGGSGIVLLPCRDGKTRRTEFGIFPLVAGIPRGVVPSGDPSDPSYANATAEARAVRLKGYGNAIQIDTAVLFIQTAFEAIHNPAP